jgi:hypothetical protein
MNIKLKSGFKCFLWIAVIGWTFSFANAANAESGILESEHFKVDYKDVLAKYPNINTTEDFWAVVNCGGQINKDCRLDSEGNMVFDLAELVLYYLEIARDSYQRDGFTVSPDNKTIIKIDLAEGTIPPADTDPFGAVNFHYAKLNQISDTQQKLNYEYYIDHVAGLCFHEYFHKVQQNEAMWTMDFINSISSNWNWAYEGSAIWAETHLAYKKDLTPYHISPESDGCLSSPHKSFMSQGASKPGYGAALFWYYLQERAAKKNRNLVKTFWKKCGGKLLNDKMLEESVQECLNTDLESAFTDYCVENYNASHNYIASNGVSLSSIYPDWLAFSERKNKNSGTGINFRFLSSYKISKPGKVISSTDSEPYNLESWGSSYFAFDKSFTYPIEISIKQGNELTDKNFSAVILPNGKIEGKILLKNIDSKGQSVKLTEAQAPDTVIILVRTYNDGIDLETRKYEIEIKADKEEPAPPPDKTAGMLDLVLCIDRSGSMLDDIKIVKDSTDIILQNLSEFGTSSNISIQYGLVVYTRHDEPAWLYTSPLTTDVNTIRSAIQGINIDSKYVGRSGNEDLYGAVMFAMNEIVNGQSIDMGWRDGAAKLIFPIGDEPPDDPDWEGRILTDVSKTAFALDPVHFYPLITPSSGSVFLNPTISSMQKLADATDGKVVKVENPEKLHEYIVSTVKMAVKRHNEEVWRKAHPPYVLYGMVGILFLVILVISILLMVSVSRSTRRI